MKKTLLALALAVCLLLSLAAVAGAATVEGTEIDLLYDDRKDLAQLLDTEVTSVEVSNETVTSTKVGTTTPDAHVLVYENGTLYAVGTGTATLTVNGTAYSVTVSPAKLNMFLLIGHSNGYGQYNDPDYAVAIEPGQTYSSFGRTSLTSANGGLGWGADVRAGGTGQGSIEANSVGNAGTPGPGSGMAYRWNQVTGEKVWVMNLSIGGSALNEWLPGVAGHHTQDYYQYKYESVQKHYGYAQQVVKNEIAAGHYTLGRQLLYYFSGGNFSLTGYLNASQADMIRDYGILWEGLKKDMAMDLDGDGKTETFDALGVVPVFRASNSGYLYDKALNYFMGTSDTYPDVFLGSEICRSWLTQEQMLANFPAPNYPTQKKAAYQPDSLYHKDQGGTSTNSIFCYYDKVHFTMVAQNAIGMDIADRALAKYDNQPDLVTYGEFRDISGAALERVTIACGETEVVVPYTMALNNGVIFETSENIRYDATGVTGLARGVGTLTMKNAEGTVLDTLTVDVAYDYHTHCICGGHAQGMTNHTCDNTENWTPWGYRDAEKTALPTKSGNYYLTSDVTITASASYGASANINICLNGHTITGPTDKRVIYNEGDLVITDCKPEGQQGQILGRSDTNGSVLYAGCAENTPTITIFGGTFSSNVTKMTKSGAVFFIGDQSGTCRVDIYGGTFVGAKSTYPGANLYIMQGSTVNMYGGVVTGADTVSYGGNVCLSNGELNVYGGTITGGKAGSGGNIFATGTAVLRVEGGQITNGTATKGASICMQNGAEIIISGGTVSAATETIRILKSAADVAAPSLTIQGDAEVGGQGLGLYLDNTYDSDDNRISITLSGLVNELRVAAATFGTVATCDTASASKVISENKEYELLYVDGVLFLANGAAEVHKGGKLVESYKTFAQAAEAAAECGGMVKLIRNVAEEATIQGDLWVDLNGFSLSGITVTGTVYGLDSTTNDYTAEKAGSLSLVSGQVAVATKTTTANAGAVRRYLAVEEEGAYSFHRFYFGITYISMNPETAGIGYRATFAGSEAVKNYLDAEAGFGLVASVDGVPADLEDGVLAAFAPSEFAQEGKTVTKRVLIRNILEEGLSQEALAERAKTMISAVSFLQTKQGDVILSTAQENTFQAMVEAIDTGFDNYTNKDQALLSKLYAQYESLMAEWEIPNLKKAA